MLLPLAILFSPMSRILNALNRAARLLLGPLAVGVVIIVLYLWVVKPLLFLAGVVALAMLVALLISVAGE